MNILLYIICLILFLLTIIIALKIIELKNIEYKKPEILSDKKILTVYYSNNGNTKSVAENLYSIVGGDLKEIELVENYSNNIFTMSKLVRKQLKEGYLPQIKDIDISNYDIIFVGSPVWNFSISLPVKTFLKNNNFENKIIVPFFTCSGGVSKNRIINELKNFGNAKEIKKPLLMFENGIFLIKEQIISWLNNI
jgi:flavodoxin